MDQARAGAPDERHQHELGDGSWHKEHADANAAIRSLATLTSPALSMPAAPGCATINLASSQISLLVFSSSGESTADGLRVIRTLRALRLIKLVRLVKTSRVLSRVMEHVTLSSTTQARRHPSHRSPHRPTLTHT